MLLQTRRKPYANWVSGCRKQVHHNEDTLLFVSHGGDCEDVWYIGSGASKHMIGNKNFQVVECNFGEVKVVGDRKSYKVSGISELEFKIKQ